MKVLHFTIPLSHHKSVITEQLELPHHFPYLHRHNEIQITWIQKGDGILVAGNNMHNYKSGEIYLLGSNLPHLFKSNPSYFCHDSNTSVKHLSIYFYLDGAFSSFFDIPEMKNIKLFLQQHQKGFKIPEAHFKEISELMNIVSTENAFDQLMYFFQLLNTLNLFNSKLEPLSTYGAIPTITENEGIRIGNIYNFIIQNYNKPITLEDVAKTACMTPESFCRYFKKHTEITFISFLNKIRINEACKKLTEHKFECISIAAYKCGFTSITNFNRVFKSIIGCSPREYVNNYTKNVQLEV